jgi:hypothetical protein
MSRFGNWRPVEGTVESILKEYPKPFEALRQGQTPALILKQSYPASHCAGLVRRFYQRELLYEPKPDRKGEVGRIDIGTSLGTHYADPDRFFKHAASTRRLFEALFDGYRNPVETIYTALSRLLPDKRVEIARELDGRLYGPAIFRCYHAGLGHRPHYDSVSKRSRLFHYAASGFEHQFAAVMCFQNSEETEEENSGQALVYNVPFQPEVGEYLANDSFQDYVKNRGIARIRVSLEPGDIYFFFSENIHEVPSVVGATPRVVLATFIGLSEDKKEVFVWA